MLLDLQLHTRQFAVVNSVEQFFKLVVPSWKLLDEKSPSFVRVGAKLQ